MEVILPKKNSFEIIIIGAGPGGLACATELAENGRQVLVIEKNAQVGPKVCAGGVTWSGLGQYLPDDLIEKSFPEQIIQSNLQRIRISSAKPIISTVDRKKLGQYMLSKAENAGVTVKISTDAKKISRRQITTNTGDLEFKYLVGADGSSSIVRKFLGIPTKHVGVGIHHQVPGAYDKMEWHLNSKLFDSGYAWIFPHKTSASIGAYAYRPAIPPKELQQNFYQWVTKKGIDLKNSSPKAALINFDYRGICFGNFFLVGDAAGLASGLTGEGIYPAILSGHEAASAILTGDHPSSRLKKLLRRHTIHKQLTLISSRHKICSKLIMEILVAGLRIKCIPFSALEMGCQD
ncbi:MAG: NAD(P)/FAD-dependent oxidoreductase [Proteobacteria bacterium]|nr:NAD(P)/FAD-dependent oxidoreductase [Pseudomonadota bacterium]MBU1709647.1 NAD(P)/FAD-dependent oxidoreductase [Pseudomonadota bacterium]